MNKTVCAANTVILSTLLAVLFSTRSFSQDADGPDILSKMRSFDEAFLQSHTIVLRIQTPAKRDNEYERGRKITKITTTSHDGAMAVEREISYTDTPAYREKTPATEIDYRPDGRLIVWRHTRERSLLEPDFQGHSDELTCVLVSPDGQTTEFQAGNPSFDLYRPSDAKRHLFMWIPIWSTGRGFTRSLSSINEVSQSEDGLITFTASGVLHPRVQGTWRMVVDPKAGYLVRSASFAAARAAAPSFVCTTSGTKWFDSCALAERANVSRGLDLVDQTVRTATIEDYKPQADMALFEKTRKILRGPLPKGARVYDWVINPQNVVAYIAGVHPLSDDDLLDTVAEANLPAESNQVSDKPNSGAAPPHDSNEIKKPSQPPVDRNDSSDQNTRSPAAGANARSPFFWTLVALIACAIVAIAAIRYAKSKK
ncbi:MAG: hypothetical protein JSU94_13865 [Phycisphaerales bacterium]|nr:MAG: hypothetical protein JSU94_13865 [Phycisphaerales bacterium]